MISNPTIVNENNEKKEKKNIKYMKIILLRFESEKIHFLECSINSWELILWDKMKISLENHNSRGGKYFQLLQELSHMKEKYSPDYFWYQSPMKYRWAIKDEEWYANSAILHLFCKQNKAELLELTSPIVRQKLWVSVKDLKKILETEKKKITENFKVAKSDKLLDWLVYLSVVKNNI